MRSPRPRLAGIAATLACLASTALTEPAAHAAADLTFADFEGADYAPWGAEGEAFGAGPSQGPLPNQMRVEGFRGRGFVNSYHGGDATRGQLTSPEFRIERRYIAFRIGGGRSGTRAELLVEGAVARTATGDEQSANGAELLEPAAWDVANLAGKTARLRLVDEATGGWGHITLDDVVFTDALPAGLKQPATRQIALDGRYLNLPVKTGAPKTRFQVLVGGKSVRDFEIELSDEPGWWAFAEVGEWRGQSATLEVARLDARSRALAMVTAADTFQGAADLYREALRPQFHFSPRRGWNNDPNGLVYFEGEWHLFFQHNPYGWNWGNMHWGHAVSRDLVHWDEVGEALYPDALGTMFSGSAVVDGKNSSGLGREGVPPIVLLYTAAGGTSPESAGQPFTQCLAFSPDRGRTWAKYSGNPILKQITPGNRDPKVFWHEPTQRWIMTLYVETNGQHTIQFFNSPNLREWTYLSEAPGFFECPDFFALPVDGRPELKKWVLTAASSEYRVGDFDGTRFAPETPKLPGQRGRGFYAAQTYSDAPQGRRIQIGWGQMPSPGMPFNQLMCLPCELKLRSTPEGPRLTWEPVAELTGLRASTRSVPPGRLAPGANPLAGFTAELVELVARVEPPPAGAVGLNLRGQTIRYDTRTGELAVNELKVPVPLQGGQLDLRIFCDRTSLEVFAQQGLFYVPMPAIPKADDRSVSAFAEGGEAKVHQLEAHRLTSIWPQTKQTELPP